MRQRETSSNPGVAVVCLPCFPRSMAALVRRMSHAGLVVLVWASLRWNAVAAEGGTDVARQDRFRAATVGEATRWQERSRETLFRLMMGGGRPERVGLEPRIERREAVPGAEYELEEISLQSVPDRRVHAWMAVPRGEAAKARRRGAVLALHGHGGSGEQVVRGQSLYWYGRAFAERGYVVISPDIGQHTLQHTNWSLMGERVWDAMRCVDYLETRPEVDRRRMVVAGLSLGGETTMYVAAMDPRLKAACSSGWLTTVENMKHGHCPCWNFPGLEAHFDFSDIFACVAPRPLVLEIGMLERAPGGFPADIARPAFAEIAEAYAVFGAKEQVVLDLHAGGHVYQGNAFLQAAHRILNSEAGRDRR